MSESVKKASYRKLVGKPFDPKTFKKDVEACAAIPQHLGAYSLDFGRDMKIDAWGEYIEAEVKAVPYEGRKALVEEYMNRWVPEIRHKSPSHELKVKQDGNLSLDFLYNGSSLSKSGDVYYGLLKSPRQVTRQVREWSDIAAGLGLNTLPPVRIKMDGECEALKICTQFNKVEEGKVNEYVTGVLLKELDRPGSKLELSAEDATLTMDADSVKMKASNDWGVRFFFDMAGEPKGDPVLAYKTPDTSYWESIKDWVFWHENAIILGSIGIAIPGLFAGLTGAMGMMNEGRGWEYAKGGALIGTIIDTSFASVVYGFEARNELRRKKAETKQKANSKFMQLAKDQPHIKPEYGSCVVLSTESCAIESVREKPVKKSGIAAALSLFGMTPKE